jgi:glycosyltransferase involved in cell wall biosynthesis
LPLDKRLVLFVGAIEKQLKRIDLARDAVARLKSQNMDVELIEVHDEPYNRIPLYMNACDVLILPSEREGSPQVVKEAMACNLPVVATAVGDVPDVLAGVEGCCICQRDPADIAWKLENVLNNRQRTCGRNAVRSYEIGTIAKMIVQTYEGVLSKRCGHG